MRGVRFAVVLAAVFCLGLAGPILAAPITTTWTWGGSDYNWGAVGNWDSGVPNNTTEDKYTAVINDNHNILVNGIYTIETLQNNGLGVLTIGYNQRLGLDSGASSVNHGTIELKDTSSSTSDYAYLFIYGGVGLGGTGSVEFASAYQNRIYDGGSGHLTLGADQTIRTSGTLGHKGDILVALTNNGTVRADNGTVTLSRAGTNNNLMEAVNAGLLVIDGVTLTNSSGTLTAQSGSTVKLGGATVIGGTLNGPGDFEIAGTNHLDGSGGILLNSNVLAGAADYLYLKGDVTNNGRIELKDLSASTSDYAGLFFVGGVNLDGTGTVELASGNQNRLYAGTGGYLNLGADQTIRTTGTGSQGDIYVGLTNDGLISADNGAITLLSANKTNNNRIEAVNNGWLGVSGITLTNTGAEVYADGTSTVQLNGATVIGGTLNGPGDFEISGSTTLDGTGGLLMASNFLAGTYDYLYLKGDITNNGRIELKDASSSTGDYSILYAIGAVNLGGTGTVELASGYQNRIHDGGSGYLNLGADQTIRTTGTGSRGDIYVGLTNDGLISANNGTISLLSANKTNNNRIEAVNSGQVNISGITLTNTGAEVYADGTSTVQLNGATVIGGTLSGPGDFEISGSTTLDGTGGLVMASNFLAGTYDYLYLKGDITNNGRIEFKDASSSTGDYSILYASGTVNLGGTGGVEFAGGYQNRIGDGGSGHLNLGANQTIRTTGTGSQGDILVGLTNDGLISADQGTITLLTAGKTNNNRIEAVNYGQVNINNITLTNTGGEVYVDETSTLQLSSATVFGGTIGGNGVVNIAATSTLDGTGGGLTINPDTKLGTTKYLYLKGDITNNGRIEIKDTSSSTGNYSILYATGTVNLGGTGSVAFASNYQNWINDGGAGHLIVGPDQTITAGSGTSGVINVRTTVHGTLQADGGSLTLPTNLTNNGLVRSANGSTLNVNNAVGGTGGWTADGGTLNVNANLSTTGAINVINAGHLLVNGVTMTGSNLFVDAASSFAVNSGLSLTGDFGFALTDETNWVWGASAYLALNGRGSNQQSLEIGGHDYGLDAAGFSANFDLPKLKVEGTETYVYLADLFDNGNRSSPEALYVDDLDVLVGATLNLNGLHLYTWLDDEIHLVAAGEGDLFGGGLIIDEEVSAAAPLPGSIWLLAGGLIGLLALKRRNSWESG